MKFLDEFLSNFIHLIVNKAVKIVDGGLDFYVSFVF